MEGDRDGETPRGAPVEVIRVEGDVTPPEENADLPDFIPECAYLLLEEVYGENAGSHLDREVANKAIWQRCWRRLATQLARWYATPSGAVGHRFTEILAAEWWGVLGRSWNTERPLVFAHIVLTKTLGVRRAKDIHGKITRRMDLWERGLHTDLAGDAEVEGASREGRAASGR